MGIAFWIRALHVQNRHVRTDRPHSQKFLICKRTPNRSELPAVSKVAAPDSLSRKKGQSCSRRLQAEAYRKIRMLFDFDRVGNSRLGRAAIVMPKAGSHIA